MLGVGLDSDGHKRVTTGPNFALVGGSKETHDEMTDKALRFNEELKKPFGYGNDVLSSGCSVLT